MEKGLSEGMDWITGVDGRDGQITEIDSDSFS